ncbi:MAG: hypothetical protein SCARUB_00730 [Candidatus Scalindua rubra]|uniref:Uncharacterized protein n=1 Tax=Candidatus Scalindua rubra TaxID=1872076 RepID=A0A1E3XEZ4_9BACT|nr:MAG: hypothetical protein SCARUB_00730 [Candidatus Scalindua rubra]
MSGLSLNEIKPLFAIDAYTTVSMANSSIKKRLNDDQHLRRKIEKIKKQILGSG